MLELAAIAVLALSSDLGRAEPARERDYDLTHVRAELAFDLAAHEVIGLATLSITPLHPLAAVKLDASNLQVASVRVAKRAVDYSLAGNAITFTPPSPGAFDVTIRYRAKPRRGLFFLSEGGRVRQIYTQGFPDDNHHWLPVYDFPNDKTTSEILLTVPRDWATVSNGSLVSTQESGALKTVHWRLDKPQPTYLISFVAGEMDCAAEGTIESCLPRGQGKWAQLSFGRTADAMRFFESKIAPYPWPRYSQIVLRDAMYGGMENTGAVTYAPNFLLTPELVGDYQRRNDTTIAHELAHQWFGDSVTIADFRHLWLSEGFATAMANLWVESYFGPEEAARDRERSRQSITSTPSMQRFPLVRRAGVEDDPVALLAYQKGGWVLHMLRRQLGDEEFWRVIREWYRSKAYGNATTEELAAAFGPRGAIVFDQYVRRPGHPEFALAWRWDAGRVVVTVEQKAEVFRLPVVIEVDGTRRTMQVANAKDEFVFPLDHEPKTVRFDPDHDWLAAITMTPALKIPAAPKPALAQLLATARTDPSWVRRVRALQDAVKLDPAVCPEFLAADSPREMIRAAALQSCKFHAAVANAWAAPGKPSQLRVAALGQQSVSISRIRLAAADENHRVRMAAASAYARLHRRRALAAMAANDPLDIVAEHARGLLDAMKTASR